MLPDMLADNSIGDAGREGTYVVFVPLLEPKPTSQSALFQTELDAASPSRVKQHDFAVVLLLLDGQSAPGLPFLRQLHWVTTADPTSEKSLAQVMDAAAGGGAPSGELRRHTAPYRGLYAMTESDADYFFGRGRETATDFVAMYTSVNSPITPC